MTPPDSPSALLERAAERLTELAAHFGGYVENFDDAERTRFDSPVESWSYDLVDRNATSSSRAWVETMNPSAAQPLVEWLRYAQVQYEVAERRAQDRPSPLLDDLVSGSDRAALAFARQVLGES